MQNRTGYGEKNMSEDITSLLKKFEAGELSQADLLYKVEMINRH